MGTALDLVAGSGSWLVWGVSGWFEVAFEFENTQHAIAASRISGHNPFSLQNPCRRVSWGIRQPGSSDTKEQVGF